MFKKYEFLEVLGKGAYGTVNKVRNIFTGDFYVIKSIENL